MSIEVKIQRGEKHSKKNEKERADIVVYKTTNPQKRDQNKDILGVIETKRPTRREGVRQLTTYMSATSCYWGVWTNGKEIEYLYKDVNTGEIKDNFVYYCQSTKGPSYKWCINDACTNVAPVTTTTTTTIQGRWDTTTTTMPAIKGCQSGEVCCRYRSTLGSEYQYGCKLTIDCLPHLFLQSTETDPDIIQLKCGGQIGPITKKCYGCKGGIVDIKDLPCEEGYSTALIDKCEGNESIIKEPKSVSLPYDKWTKSAPAMRIKSACSTSDNCDVYKDLEGTGKTYVSSCESTAEIVTQLELDSKTVCSKSMGQKRLKSQ